MKEPVEENAKLLKEIHNVLVVLTLFVGALTGIGIILLF